MARAIDPDNLDPASRLLKNFDDAWLTDLALIRELTRQEKQAEEDRAFAARLAGVTLHEIPEDERKMAMLIDDYDDDDDDDDDDGVEQTVSSASPAVNPATISTNQQSKTKKCASCLELVRRRDPRVPCGHVYCIGCLRKLFLLSLQDETLMPPRCCQQEIPTHLAALTPKELQDFGAKRLEYSTTDRLYCSQPICSTFIPPFLIVNSVGTCPNSQCRMTTCPMCKAAGHGNLDCPKDEATIALLAAADEAGWTRCYHCRAVVELTHGCYHITCRCRAEFCYLCSKPWKTCTCAQWDEQRLLVEARIRTARVPVPQIQRGGEQINLQDRVLQMADQLRANVECRHTTGWVYTAGGGRCEECHDYLPQYLYRCSGCHLMACNRCRHNRF